MNLLGLPINCAGCGGGLDVVSLGTPIAGRETNSVLRCSSCNVEWLVKVRMLANVREYAPLQVRRTG